MSAIPETTLENDIHSVFANYRWYNLNLLDYQQVKKIICANTYDAEYNNLFGKLSSRSLI
jgi:hypothetical protein